MADVTLEKVEKKFGEVHAVCGVDLAIKDQEFVVLVGPSGCGKTTTLRMIAGLEDVSAGDIRIGGRSVTHLPPRDRDIAMVFQSYALYPHMTVEKNLSFSLRLRGVPKAEIARRVQDVAKILGLGEQLQRKPRQLSGGQRQRVAVGAALCRQAGVLLFDEPLSNLDAKLRVHMRTELKRLHHSFKSTMIYVTHDQVEAMTMGDRIVLMNRGVVCQVGTPLDLYERPATRFVAGFIGSPPMNFFEGRLDIAGDTPVVELAHDLRLPLPRRDLGAAGGRRVVFGIRPEHIEVADGGRPGAVRVAAVVDEVEPLGHEAIVTARCAAGVFQVQTERYAGVQRLDRLEVWFRMERAFVFDGESECAM
jgi:multiple sugar transport system ATP-binding protein